ncbi:MAG: adenosylcobinamide amidohydrolase, partial [Desulfosudaceae bacterium]
LLLLLLVRVTPAAPADAAFPLTITDDLGRQVTFAEPPRRVVSLVPTASEIMVELGADKFLKGVTWHSAELTAGSPAVVVGGFAAPAAERIAALDPDLVILADLHHLLPDQLDRPQTSYVFLKTRYLADSFDNIRLLGDIFGREKKAEEITAGIRDDLDLIAAKVARIPEAERKRAIRIMGRESVMTPGADSFQNQLIRAAGGLSPDIDQDGDVIDVSREQWRRFDPQFIYGCGRDQVLVERFFDRSGWKEAAAVKNHRIRFYPCDLTCRAATNTGKFVSWLAADMYTASFSRTDQLVQPETIVSSRPVDLAAGGTEAAADGRPAYVADCRVVHSRLFDFINKTLLIDFDTPLTVLSSLDGWRDDVRTVGNHSYPPPCWSISHAAGISAYRDRVLAVLDKPADRTALLFTGADMDNLAIGRAAHRDMTVWAVVTAGVAGNAMRASRDSGFYYEPGTINMILLTSRRLSPRAMTRAVITATEAKTAALLDLDVRSSYADGRYRATGTGTDNIIVVQGRGPAADKAGGHTRLGELIGRAVHEGVQQAVFRQNRLTPGRTVFQRLDERGLSIGGLVGGIDCPCAGGKNRLAADLEKILLDPETAGFIELALAVNDDYEKGLIRDLGPFNRLAADVCRKIAGEEDRPVEPLIENDALPEVTRTAFNALLTGIVAATEKETP